MGSWDSKPINILTRGAQSRFESAERLTGIQIKDQAIINYNKKGTDLSQMQYCAKCNGNISGKRVRGVFKVCPCTTICDSCLLDTYVIYNFSPVLKVETCSFCNKHIENEVKNWLYQFTLSYFSSEFAISGWE